jgi:hypothetical protein
MSIYSPFSKSELLPQEEKLEVARHKSELFIDYYSIGYFFQMKNYFVFLCHLQVTDKR